MQFLVREAGYENGGSNSFGRRRDCRFEGGFRQGERGGEESIFLTSKRVLSLGLENGLAMVRRVAVRACLICKEGAAGCAWRKGSRERPLLEITLFCQKIQSRTLIESSVRHLIDFVFLLELAISWNWPIEVTY